jgi:predicted peptidase
MRRLPALIVLFSVCGLVAQSLSATSQTNAAVDGFVAGNYHSPGGEFMHYRLFVPPGYDPAQKYPIILWLHDASARGADNLAQISGSNRLGARIWTTPENQNKYHAFVLAPQVSDTKGWARPHANTPPVSIRLALEILDTVETKYSIDRSREYIAGQSMGGEGVWRGLSIDPHRFAAAIVLCGYADDWIIPRVANIPVWIFQGQADPTVNPARARQWVAKLQANGGDPEFSEYPGIGHDVWDVAFAEPGLVAWLLSHHLGTKN